MIAPAISPPTFLASFLPAACVLALLVARLCLRLWLARRQMHHVAAHAASVPARFASQVSPADHAKAAQYTLARQRLAVWGALLDAAAFALLAWGGVLQAILQAAQGLAGTGLAGALAFAAAVAVLLSLIELPLEWVRQFRVEERFGFNRMTPAMFVADQAKGAALAAVIGLPLLAAILEVMAHAGPWWWLGAWLLWCAFTFTMVAVYPRVIAPIFNRFTPLPAGPLLDRIASLLGRTGFRSDGVFTMDGSRRSSHGNAYFTGLGSSKRVVFFDTLLERLDEGEIEAVLAHELGHFRLGHIARGLAVSLALGLAWLAALGVLAGEPLFFEALGMHAPPPGPLHDAGALVLFALASPLLTFVLAPVQGAISRRHEFQADAFAARHARAEALASALVKLTRDNASTLTPDRLYSAFYDSHPPAPIRIERLLAAAPLPTHG
jgi:STE24 endopeptidase